MRTEAQKKAQRAWSIDHGATVAREAAHRTMAAKPISEKQLSWLRSLISRAGESRYRDALYMAGVLSHPDSAEPTPCPETLSMSVASYLIDELR